MTAKELLLQEAPTWSEEQAERALRAAHAQPGDAIDEWGDLDTQTDRAVARVMHDLAAEEQAELGGTIAQAWGYERRT